MGITALSVIAQRSTRTEIPPRKRAFDTRVPGSGAQADDTSSDWRDVTRSADHWPHDDPMVCVGRNFLRHAGHWKTCGLNRFTHRDLHKRRKPWRSSWSSSTATAC